MSLFSQSYEHTERSGRPRNITSVIMGIGIISISILFTPFVVRLMQVKMLTPSVIRPEFTLGIFSMLAGAWLLQRGNYYKKRDALRRLRFSLLAALFIGMVFIALQFRGWLDIFPASAGDVNIVKVLVLVHLAHFVVGLISLIPLILRLYQLRDSAQLFIYYLDPKRNEAWSAKCAYWNFITLLWIILYCILAIKAL